MLYFDHKSGIKAQQRYVQYQHELEFLWPVCDAGFPEEPGTCEVVGGYEVLDSGCGGSKSTGIELGAMAFLAGMIGLRRRKVRS